VSSFGVWQYRISRALGRLVTTLAAILTLHRMPPFVSTSAVVLQGNRLLVVIDPIRREPVLPGGHLKWTEPPQHAVIREVEEETGYIVQPERLIGALGGIEWTGEPGVVRLIYQGTIVGGSLRSSSEGEATWMDLDEMMAANFRDASIVRFAVEAAGVDRSDEA
jgi:ADP-ribose pyrophosphatase YjhB (NUDIX family)